VRELTLSGRDRALKKGTWWACGECGSEFRRQPSYVIRVRGDDPVPVYCSRRCAAVVNSRKAAEASRAKSRQRHASNRKGTVRPGMKLCTGDTGCGRWLPNEAFYKSAHLYTGLSTRCKECCTAYSKARSSSGQSARVAHVKAAAMLADNKAKCQSCRSVRPLDHFPRKGIGMMSARRTKCLDCAGPRTRKLFIGVELIRRGLRRCSCCGTAKALHEMQSNPQYIVGSTCLDCCIVKGRGRKDSASARDAYLIRLYGVTSDWYESTLRDQGGGCAICGSARTDRGKWLHVDHCHDTGVVRGILCSSCNKTEGAVRRHLAHIGRDASEYLSAVAAYMERWGASAGEQTRLL
jgi:hypothetical protein